MVTTLWPCPRACRRCTPWGRSGPSCPCSRSSRHPSCLPFNITAHVTTMISVLWIGEWGRVSGVEVWEGEGINECPTSPYKSVFIFCFLLPRPPLVLLLLISIHYFTPFRSFTSYLDFFSISSDRIEEWSHGYLEAGISLRAFSDGRNLCCFSSSTLDKEENS